LNNLDASIVQLGIQPARDDLGALGVAITVGEVAASMLRAIFSLISAVKSTSVPSSAHRGARRMTRPPLEGMNLS
jgi:hypothetical protein